MAVALAVRFRVSPALVLRVRPGARAVAAAGAAFELGQPGCGPHPRIEAAPRDASYVQCPVRCANWKLLTQRSGVGMKQNKKHSFGQGTCAPYPSLDWRHHSRPRF